MCPVETAGYSPMYLTTMSISRWEIPMRFTRRAVVAAVGVAALLTATACGSSDDNSSNGGGSGAKKVEVFTWWADGGEKAGLDGLVAQFGKDCAGQEFVNGAVAGGA